MVVNDQKSWNPPTDSAVPDADFYNESLGHKYWTAYYTSVFFLVGAEVAPITTEEYALGAILFLIGALITAYMFGEMAVVMSNLYKEQSQFTREHDLMNTAMKNYDLPKLLQYEILDYFISNYRQIIRLNEFDEFIQSLPPSLVNQINAYYATETMNQFKFFNSPEVLDYLIPKVATTFVQPEKTIFFQDDPPLNFYWLNMGICEVYLADPSGRDYRARVLQQGEYFGEIALLYKAYRTATVISYNHCSLSVLDNFKFEEMLTKFQHIYEGLLEHASRYDDRWKHFMDKNLRKNELFSEISPQSMCYVIYNGITLQLEQNKVIIQAEQQVQSFYMILEGQVELQIQIQDQYAYEFLNHDTEDVSYGEMWPFVVEKLGRGSIFCHNLFLLKQKSMIDYKCSRPTTLYQIGQKLINRLCKIEANFQLKIDEIKQKFSSYDSIQQSRVAVNIPIDIIKYQSGKVYTNERLNYLMIVLKNEVIRRIIQKRYGKIIGCVNIPLLVKRLKASTTAKQLGNEIAARRIAKGELPPEFVHVITVLTANEMDNPLLSQFTQKIIELRQIAMLASNKVNQIGLKADQNDAKRRKLSRNIKLIERKLKELDQL